MLYVLIAGGREFTDYALVEEVAGEFVGDRTDVIIVSGHARGADTLGEDFANSRSFGKEVFPITKEDWNRYGNGAGPIRNNQMAEFIIEKREEGHEIAVITFWDGKSTGTGGMNNIAKFKNIPLVVKNYVTGVKEEYNIKGGLA